MTASSTSFYYAEGETPQGPFSAAHILSLKSLGKITDETYVIQAGGTEWTTFVALQPTLKNLLPGPACPTEPLSPTQAASPRSNAAENANPPAKIETSQAKTPAPGANASFTEQMLALARSLDTPENRLIQLAKAISNNYDADESLLVRVLKTFEGRGFQGSLFFNQLSSISTELAGLLPKVAVHDQNCICLNGLDDLTAEVAGLLAKSRGSLLLGGNFTEISPKIATALSVHVGPLSLNSLTHLTGEIAALLAKNRSSLTLDGLEEIRPEIARGLAQAEALQLDGLVSLSEEVAKEFLSHKGSLALRGLKNLDAGSARHLAKRSVLNTKPEEASLTIRLEELPPDLAKEFLDSNEIIEFLGLETISAESLTILKSRKKKTEFLSFEFLSAQAKEVLGSGVGKNFDLLVDWREIEVRE